MLTLDNTTYASRISCNIAAIVVLLLFDGLNVAMPEDPDN